MKPSNGSYEVCGVSSPMVVVNISVVLKDRLVLGFFLYSDGAGHYIFIIILTMGGWVAVA
jgi:hypothetical protein